MTEFLLYLYAESPLHAGASDSLDVVDLPVQREAATGYPVVWGQSLKGALRQAADDTGWTTELTTLFGSAVGESDGEGGTRAGTLAVGDAQLVAMPVPTLRRTFAWATTAIMLGRLARKYQTLRRPAPSCPIVGGESGLAASTHWGAAKGEVLGPCVVPLPADAAVTEWATLISNDALCVGEPFRPFREKLTEDLVVVGADVGPMLLNECTEQAARVQLDAKTVKHGPFYSEYLPAETILAASLTLRGAGDTEEHRGNLRDLLDGNLLQVGGDETLGKGLVWARLIEGGGR